ncbi:hypothetical protein [Natrinema longum]|uniref:Uncharacterized protein n=1 Tax=Natrinema longum TaxID=370324 RepID=A0A8A2U3V0_9EURY|nr:hypothetical protein [Natrinema longum]MBZ6495059.1 hypothetical protein [Natrinema longum]QSW83647.1 hypothetical protein J0X27_09130 [Natrinema longum]
MELDVVDDFKQPEYTGENRCGPCTVLNLCIAAVVGSVIARKSRLGGALAVGVSIGLIYLRGYLVPGTPTLTKRYLPPEVLRWFGKDPAPDVAGGLGGVDASATADATGSGSDRAGDSTSRSGGSDTVATFDEDTATRPDDPAADAVDEPTATNDEHAIVDLETFFLDHEVLEPCDEQDDLCLTAEFETAWFDEIEPLDESGVGAGAAVDAFGFEADVDEFDLVTREETRVLLFRSTSAGRWPSRSALIADVAASRALETWIDGWDAFDPETKGEVLNSLRMFLETCPSGGDVRMGEEVVESCCTSHQVVAVTCEETGERLFEQSLADTDA